MFKKLKIFFVSLAMIPCMIFMSACAKPQDPPAGSLTTEQKNEGFGYLKNTLSQDYSAKASKTSVVSTSTSSSTVGTMDFSQTSIPEQAQQEIEVDGRKYE